ncbi:hypothetical protein LIER_43751 [Lithospermum erythrorhizon]|uniref:Uncharacterized protein n=1 Tax=Lithospermum erythrorhizon TaxID=34254 RepID=A0AAV3QQG3_LITER
MIVSFQGSMLLLCFRC